MGMRVEASPKLPIKDLLGSQRKDIRKSAKNISKSRKKTEKERHSKKSQKKIIQKQGEKQSENQLFVFFFPLCFSSLSSGKEFEVGIFDVKALVCCSTKGLFFIPCLLRHLQNK
ncbi:hypothetical protein H5410_050362 [Solanum commersonii]|uniref:Uncharacterized protein n=1 Tax=Solanum commersonii TaxID=4109 RepID=A0A9J5WWK8_SOLCO|nr:hypothetical protein H5410_050362 [Solanum commersonii]